MIKQPFNWPAFKCEADIQTHTLMHIPLVAEVEGIRGARSVHTYVWTRIVLKRNGLEYFFLSIRDSEYYDRREHQTVSKSLQIC